MKKIAPRKFKVKITKGHHEAPTWEGQACHKDFFPLLFPHPGLLTFHNVTSNPTRQPFLLTSSSPHPLPLERCKVNISIGLQWPVSAALISTLLFESSIVPDLLAWFACLWIMAREPLSGLLPSTPFLLIWHSKHILYDSALQRAAAWNARPSVQHWLRFSIPVCVRHTCGNSPDAPPLFSGQRWVILKSGSYNFAVPEGPRIINHTATWPIGLQALLFLHLRDHSRLSLASPTYPS